MDSVVIRPTIKGEHVAQCATILPNIVKPLRLSLTVVLRNVVKCITFEARIALGEFIRAKFFSISRHRFSRLQKRYRRTKTSLRANKFAKSKMGFMIQSLNALYSAVYCTAYRVQLFCAYYLSDRKFLFLRYSISHVYSSTSPNTACVLRMLCFPPVVFDHQGEQFGADRVIQYMEKLRITQHEVNSHKSQSD